jgi:hypothetical protein
MAKASVTLRIEPHEVGVICEALRLYSQVIQNINTGLEPLEGFWFDRSVMSGAPYGTVVLAAEEIRIALGGQDPPRPQTELKMIKPGKKKRGLFGRRK